MLVVNIAGFNFTLPSHLCPNNRSITIPFDGKVYQVPDVVFYEPSLRTFLKIVRPPIVQPPIQNKPVEIPKVKEIEVPKEEIPKNKRRGPKVKKGKVLGKVSLKDSVRKELRKTTEDRFHYVDKIPKTPITEIEIPKEKVEQIPEKIPEKVPEVLIVNI